MFELCMTIVILNLGHTSHQMRLSLPSIFNDWTDSIFLTTLFQEPHQHQQGENNGFLAQIEKWWGTEFSIWADNGLNRNFIRQRKYKKIARHRLAVKNRYGEKPNSALSKCADGKS